MRKYAVFVLAILLSASAFAQSDPELETKLIQEISDLVAKIKAEKIKCETIDWNASECNTTTLAATRFELKTDLAKAKELRKALEGDIEKAKDEATKAPLKERLKNLVAEIERVKGFDFPSETTALDDGKLIEFVSTFDDQLTALEQAERKTIDETRTAKHEMRKAKREKRDADAEKYRKERIQLQKQRIQLRKQRIQLRSQLAQLERQLRAQGVADRAIVKKIDDTLKSGKLELDFNKLVAQRKATAAELGEIEGLVTLPADDNPLYRVYDDDYEDWWIHTFYMGVEFDTVSTIFNKGFPRIGYSNSAHFGGEGTPESHPRRGRGHYGFFYEFDALLTSSAEQTIQKGLDGSETDPCSSNFKPKDEDDSKPCVRKAFEVEQKIFWPLLRTTRHNRLRHYFGPVASIGARFVDRPTPDPAKPEQKDESIHANYRYYVGTHLGFARDGYGEILYGRTSGVDGRRFEVRGEVPVAHWGTDSRLLLGWVANFRAGRVRKGTAAEPKDPVRDSFRVYLTYNLDFFKLTGLKAPKAE